MNLGLLNLEDLDRDYLCIIHLVFDLPPILRQVTLRRDQIHDGLIRLGATPDDEANGWQYPETIEVKAILGVAVQNEGKWSCRPMLEVVKDSVA